MINFSDIKEKKSPYLDVEIPIGNYDIYDFFLSLDDQNIKTTVSRSNEWFHGRHLFPSWASPPRSSSPCPFG